MNDERPAEDEDPLGLEDRRSNLSWLLGLLGVVVFLLLMSTLIVNLSNR